MPLNFKSEEEYQRWKRQQPQPKQTPLQEIKQNVRARAADAKEFGKARQGMFTRISTAISSKVNTALEERRARAAEEKEFNTRLDKARREERLAAIPTIARAEAKVDIARRIARAKEAPAQGGGFWGKATQIGANAGSSMERDMFTMQGIGQPRGKKGESGGLFDMKQMNMGEKEKPKKKHHHKKKLQWVQVRR